MNIGSSSSQPGSLTRLLNAACSASTGCDSSSPLLSLPTSARWYIQSRPSASRWRNVASNTARSAGSVSKHSLYRSVSIPIHSLSSSSFPAWTGARLNSSLSPSGTVDGIAKPSKSRGVGRNGMLGPSLSDMPRILPQHFHLCEGFPNVRYPDQVLNDPAATPTPHAHATPHTENLAPPPPAPPALPPDNQGMSPNHGVGP